MKANLERIRAEVKAKLESDDADIEQIKVMYLGKKGELTQVLRGMGSLSAEERPIIGQLANEVRADIEALIEDKSAKLKQKKLELKLRSEKLDVTVDGKFTPIGRIHPLTQVQRELENIFVGMGFQIVEGPEVEFDYYNFQALNIPENHPARILRIHSISQTIFFSVHRRLPYRCVQWKSRSLRYALFLRDVYTVRTQ